MTVREYDLGRIGTSEFYKKVVEMHRDGLVSFRKTTALHEELEWEIRLYDFILEDPVTRYPQYQDARYSDDNVPIEKRDAVKKLGWVVP